MKRILRITASLAVLGMAIFGTQVHSAPPAQAVNTCNLWDAIGWSATNGGSVIVPYTGSTGNPSLNCAMWAGFFPDYALPVEVLQKSLNRCYGENLTPDGVFGWRTEDALERAQADEGIGVDGIYGYETARGIKFAKAGSGCGKTANSRG